MIFFFPDSFFYGGMQHSLFFFSFRESNWGVCNRFQLQLQSMPHSAFEGRPGVSCFPGPKQWFICDRSGFVTCARVFMHTAAHRGCRNTVRDSICTGSRFWEKNILPHQGIEPESVSIMAPVFLGPRSISCGYAAPVCQLSANTQRMYLWRSLCTLYLTYTHDR